MRIVYMFVDLRWYLWECELRIQSGYAMRICRYCLCLCWQSKHERTLPLDSSENERRANTVTQTCINRFICWLLWCACSAIELRGMILALSFSFRAVYRRRNQFAVNYDSPVKTRCFDRKVFDSMETVEISSRIEYRTECSKT